MKQALIDFITRWVCTLMGHPQHVGTWCDFKQCEHDLPVLVMVECPCGEFYNLDP